MTAPSIPTHGKFARAPHAGQVKLIGSFRRGASTATVYAIPADVQNPGFELQARASARRICARCSADQRRWQPDCRCGRSSRKDPISFTWYPSWRSHTNIKQQSGILELKVTSVIL